MSYASLLPEILRSSTSVAALTSLGIHGLLWVVLPVLPLDSKSVETQLQQNVGVVELTPEEQSRLPQASTPEGSVPSFDTQSSGLPPLPPPPTFNLLPPATQSSALPPLPPPSTFNLISPPPIQPSVLPPLPPSASFKILPPTTQPSVLPPLPPPGTFKLVPPSEMPIAKYPIGAPLPNQNNPSFTPRFPVGKQTAPAPSQIYGSGERLPTPYRLKLPANSGLPSTRGLKPGEPLSLPDTPPTGVIAQVNTNPQNTNQPQNQPQSQELAANPVTQSAQPGKLPERGKQELLALQQQARERLAQSNNTPAPLRREALVKALRQQQPARNSAGSMSQPIARGNTNATTPATSAKSENASQRSREERLAALQQKLQPQQPASNSGSSRSVKTAQEIQQLKDFEVRQQRVQEENSKVETKAPIRQKLKTCQKQLDGSFAYVGAVVNPQGNIVSGPDLISKTGAADIEQAKASVRNYSFPATSNTTNYNFTVEFDYDTGKCPAEATPEPSLQSKQTPK